ncbi:MAG: mechanosensitive ion channel family protein, partial [Bacteriovoracaceae bacterium]|nr:mechanosensitive ion channel family protein [Bacteriovoracaceae bacterium]
MKEIITTYGYPASVTLTVLALYLAGNFSLLNKKRRMLKKAKKREVFDPIHSDTPDEIDDKEIFKLGIDSIQSRFVFIQRLFPLLMVIAWLIILSIPYLSALPAIYISLVVTIVSVAAGIALKPFLENIIAGVIISFFQPFRVGDTVRIEGQYGVVERIDLTQCVLRVWDWERYVIPNSKMLIKEIQNLTMHDSIIWAHIEFWVEPSCDMELIEKLAKQAANDSNYSLDTEEPVFWVTKLDKDAVECWIAAWAENPTDAWELRCDMRKNINQSLMKAGIKTQSIQANIQNLALKP